jgi:hypothetical protein
MRFDGSFWAFPLTEAERDRTGDPRRSVEARYPTKDDYLARVESAVKGLQKERLLLPADAETYRARARGMAWPPTSTDGPPYWLEDSAGR